MKHSILIRSVVVLSFLLSGRAANAQNSTTPNYQTVVNNLSAVPSFEMSILPDSTGERFVLTVSNPQKKKLQLSIYHAVFGYMYAGQFSDEYLQKVFNLSKADDGLYKVEISCGRERYSRQFNMNTYTEVSRKLELK